MLGIAFYNSLIPYKSLEYILMPMYSFGAKDVVGTGRIAKYWYTDGIFQQIRLSVSGYRFSNGYYNMIDDSDPDYSQTPVQFNRIKPELSLLFRKKYARSSLDNSISISHYRLLYDRQGLRSNDDVIYSSTVPTNSYYINKFTYSHSNGRIINPYNFSISLEQGDGFVKTFLEANYRLSYKNRLRGVDIRFFTGRFLYNNYNDLRFGFAIDGNRDYLYDEVFLGRGENPTHLGGEGGMLSRQFIVNDGGMKSYMNINPAQTWLTALNIKIPLGKKIPFAIYTDYGWTSSNPVQPVYDVGVALILIPGVFEVYFPFYTSTVSNLIYPQYEKNIRFVLNLSKLNPFDLFRKIPS